MPIIFKTFVDVYVNNRNSKSRRISTRRNGAKENRISATVLLQILKSYLAFPLLPNFLSTEDKSTTQFF